MNFILLGPPGAGKGTQALLFMKKYKLKHISTGELLRKEYTKKTPLGIKAFSYWGKGLLTPDPLIIQLLLKHLPTSHFLLDGFPRTLAQARLLERKKIQISRVIYIHTSKKIILDRLLKRATIEGRKDDTKHVIEKRLQIYHHETEPLLAFYKDKLIRVNGNTTPENVFHEIILKIQ